MTEEQIEQNVEEYTNTRKYTLDELANSILTVEEIVKLAYIAGAHSRDEEIEELKKKLEDMTKLKNLFASTLDIYDKDNQELQCELNLLRNPWVDVNNKSNRPKKGEQIIIAFDDIEKYLLKYTDEDLFKIWNAHQWMPIPEPPKGE